MNTYVVAYLSGAGVLALYWLVCVFVERTWRIWRLAEGADGRLSTSKAQWLLWTFAVAFAYVVVYAARAYRGDHSALSAVPQNVLIALGFSSVTMATAKGIAGYAAGGKTPQQLAAAAQGTAGNPAQVSSGLKDLVQDDTGASDLSKAQLIIWTLIAIGVFIVATADTVNTVATVAAKDLAKSPRSIPDIDTVLMVLSGLSMGGYLGKKFVTGGDVQITGLVPKSTTVTAGSNVAAITLYGAGFGDPATGVTVPPGGAVLLEGAAADIDSWSDSKITFHFTQAKVPPINALFATGAPATGSTVLDVDIVVAGLPVTQADPPLKLTVSR